ncbi:hypothetical protein CIW83_09655 [Tissierella sp. P1]|uniref:hypothetical protein n=1 Tax=Tissierella sp. P1 TaxID=1280483 RepID=UPI000BA0B8AD|nr:hypothetical protein [Tissierella sp. P1]OZV12352.1 hypothetical protein CIW83_09655 [Tissierella sp. P1]
MYKEYLGEGYHDKVRKMLSLNEEILPNSVIDADANIGGMKMLLAPAMDKLTATGKKIDTEQKYNQLQQAGIYYLAGILCMAMKSRTSAPPFNIPKYKKNWDKKQKGYMQKGNTLMQELMMGGVL